jgi:hypothetical protein
VALFNFGAEPAHAAVPAGTWRTALDTAAAEWLGPRPATDDAVSHRTSAELAPWSAVLLVGG